MIYLKKNPAAFERSGFSKNAAHLKATEPRLMPNGEESLAVAIMAHRYRLAIPTARAVCELAGIGRAI